MNSPALGVATGHRDSGLSAEELTANGVDIAQCDGCGKKRCQCDEDAQERQEGWERALMPMAELVEVWGTTLLCQLLLSVC